MKRNHLVEITYLELWAYLQFHVWVGSVLKDSFQILVEKENYREPSMICY